VADQKRSPLLPNVPTFVESKAARHGGRDLLLHRGAARHPARTVDYAHKAFSAALQAPDTQKKFAEQGATPAGWSPAQSGDFIRAESRKVGRVIKHRQREGGVT
jgi:tripartite-type tricarboxylate transporter receptor subunit TctC